MAGEVGAHLADLGIEIPAAAAPVAFTTAASIHSCPENLSDLARLSAHREIVYNDRVDIYVCVFLSM